MSPRNERRGRRSPQRTARARRRPRTEPPAAHLGGRDVRPVDGYGSGFDDRLRPTVPVDLSRVQSVSDLVRQYGDAAIGARAVGRAADILAEMTLDPDCFVVLTVSGAMTIAKMGLVLCDMIEHGMAQAVVCTGALMAHGFVEASGRAHFQHDPAMDDEELFRRGYNRVYDSVELEKNLDDVEPIVSRALDAAEDGTPWSSVRVHRELGAFLSRQAAGRGILRSAYEHEVPVYVPAFTDSELGLDFAIHSHRRRERGDTPLRFDPFIDLDDYTGLVQDRKRLGIFTVGGGVPRNWAQQVGPYLDIMKKRAGLGPGLIRFRYGVRICPEPAHWGGLSGCTYSEGVSWGKFVPPSAGGRFAEVFSDATIAWPLVVKAVLERLAGQALPRKQRLPAGVGHARRERRRRAVR